MGSNSVTSFDQYEPLAGFPRYEHGHRCSEATLATSIQAAESLASRPNERPAQPDRECRDRVQEHDDLALDLLAHTSEEALPRIDITVGELQTARRGGCTSSFPKSSLRADPARLAHLPARWPDILSACKDVGT